MTSSKKNIPGKLFSTGITLKQSGSQSFSVLSSSHSKSVRYLLPAGQTNLFCPVWWNTFGKAKVPMLEALLDLLVGI